MGIDGPPLVAQVFNDSTDEAASEPFDVVTRFVLALPAGDYRLKVTGTGRVGRTYRLAVNRGETVAYKLCLDEGRLLGGEYPALASNPLQERPKEEPIPFVPATAALALTPGKADLIESASQTVIRRDGVTGNPVWDASRPPKPFDRNHDPAGWIKKLSGYHGLGAPVAPAPDLDGDGIGDLVWAFRRCPSILALSGKDGSMLWSYTAELDGPGGRKPDGPYIHPGPSSREPVRPDAGGGDASSAHRRSLIPIEMARPT